MAHNDEEKLKKFAYQAFIKNVLIELPNYSFRHRPIDNVNDPLFVGRKKAKEYLLSFLRKGATSGAYLITGYRGMGKTSLVNSVVDQFVKESPEHKKIKISFGQKDVLEIDILRQLVIEVKKGIDGLAKVKKNVISKHLEKQAGISLILGFILLLIRFLINYDSIDTFIKTVLINKILLGNSINYSSYVFLVIIVSLPMLWHLIFRYYFIKKDNHIIVSEQISLLFERLNSSITSESSTQGGLTDSFLNFTSKKTKQIPIASPKEISNEIIHILDSIFDELKFIIVFDELDKIEATTSKVTYYEDMGSFISKGSGGNTIFDQRERKLRVLEILSSLKYLITEGKARFIFIAGSEMFDAALADIADRQSALSSIFNQIINIDSLLKDKSGTQFIGSGVTNILEEYISRLILPFAQNSQNQQNPFLQRLYCHLTENKYKLSQRDAFKVIYSLQHFIIFVTYRSNGSPKKMIKIIEDHCIVLDKSTIIKKQNDNLKHIVSTYSRHFESDKTFVFLNLGYKDQYKIGLLSYIFRPIIITKSRTLKQYSDSLLIATPYLLDHLLKFHPFAFSLEHLELMPEVLSSNRSPELRFFLEEMIQWMKQNLLRDTENGFFEYKFFHKIFYEISYVSKISDEESAAFNFTLDENYSVKLHLRVKIKELRSIYKDFGGGNVGTAISSLAFLNTMLGDAHYFDQEYSDAIVAYADALRMTQYSRGKSPTESDKALNISFNPSELAYLPEQSYFTISIKCMLKLGLIYEKMKSYDMALAYYYDALIILSKTFKHGAQDETTSIIFSNYRQTIINTIFSILYLLEKKESSIGEDHGKLKQLIQTIDPQNEWLLSSPEFLLNFAKLQFHRGSILYEGASKVLTELLADLVKDPISLRTEENISEEVANLKKEILNHPYVADKALKYAFRALRNEMNRWGLLELNNTADPIYFSNKNLFETLILTYEKLLKKDTRFYEQKVEIYSKMGKNIALIGDVIYSYYGCNSADSNRQSELPIIFEKMPQVDKTVSKNQIELWLEKIYGEQNDRQALIQNHFSGACAKLNPLGLAFYNYLIAAVLLHRSNEHNLAGAQYNKILSILRYHAPKIKITNEIINFLEHSLVKRLLEIGSWNSGSSDRPQVYKYKQYFGVEEIHHPKYMSKYNYLNISNAAELKEALINFAAIKLIKSSEYNKITSLQDYDQILEQALITPTNGVYTQFSRLNELGLQRAINNTLILNCYIKKEIWNFIAYNSKENGTTYNNIFFLWDTEFYALSKEFKRKDINVVDTEDLDINEKMNPTQKLQIYFGRIQKTLNHSEKNLASQLPSKHQKQELEAFPYLIANWIFCIHNILNILKTMGDSFLFAHSNLADYHRRYGNVLKYYELCRWLHHFGIIKNNIDEILVDLIGFKPLGNVDSTSQYQLAGRHYYKAIRTHNAGEEYRYMITNLYYLEDDFSDSAYLFSIAFERQRLRSGSIQKRIDAIRSEVGDSQLYRYDSYANVEKPLEDGLEID